MTKANLPIADRLGRRYLSILSGSFSPQEHYFIYGCELHSITNYLRPRRKPTLDGGGHGYN